jgi:hypothetical protein
MPSPLFFEFYNSLPREGPGDDTTTRSVLLTLDLPKTTKVLDIGCRPGAQTLVLARESGPVAEHVVFYVTRRSD